MSARTSYDVCRGSRMRRRGSSLVQENTTPVLGLASPYLVTDCIVVSSMQHRSATSEQLNIPRTKTMTFGPESFKVSGPTIWDDLPAGMKDSSLSKNSFRKLLESCLFDICPLHLRICGFYQLVQRNARNE